MQAQLWLGVHSTRTAQRGGVRGFCSQGLSGGLALVCVLAAGCQGGPAIVEKPRTLEADFSFNAAGDTVTIKNKNTTAWHKLYVTLLDDHQRRYYYIDETLTLQPNESIQVPLRAFKDKDGMPFQGTKDNHWRWRIEDGTRSWRLQKTTDFPTS